MSSKFREIFSEIVPRKQPVISVSTMQIRESWNRLYRFFHLIVYTLHIFLVLVVVSNLNKSRPRTLLHSFCNCQMSKNQIELGVSEKTRNAKHNESMTIWVWIINQWESERKDWKKITIKYTTITTKIEG